MYSHTTHFLLGQALVNILLLMPSSPRRVWAHRVCRQSVWGFSGKSLKSRAIKVYCEVNTALAGGHQGKAALEGIKEVSAT